MPFKKREILQILRIFFIFFIFVSFAFGEKRVLILNSYHKGFEWSDKIVSGIEDVFYDKDISTNILYMDSKRINSEDYYKKIGELYKIQLSKSKYDLVIAIDTFAYDFILKYYDKLFEKEPILFVGPEHFNPKKVIQKGLEDRVYGILEKRAIKDNFSIMLKLMPYLKAVTIVNDGSSNGDDTNPFILQAIEKYKKRVKISYIRHSTLEKLEKLFSEPKKDEAIFFIRFYNDENGHLYKNTKIASMIDKSKIPVFATDTLFLGRGIVGGKLVKIKELGIKSGKMALEVLNKELKPLHVEVFDGYEKLFDFKKIKEFGLKPDIFLENPKYTNTPLSFFDKYRTLVNDMFVLSPFLVFLIIGLIYNIYKRIKSEKELREAQEQKNKHQQFVIQQSKLAEIGEIFSSIAHQWKNPLVEISAIAQEQFYANEENMQNSSYMKDIMVQVGYMSDTINDFQTFIMPSSKKSVFDIEKSIQTTMKIMSHTIKYNYIDIHVNKEKAVNFKVLGYKNEFMQTLLNIFNNAKDQIKQARENKLIQRGEIDIDIYNENNRIILHVRDNGGGIKADNVEHVFEPYFTTKKQGHGIGLYMSKLIIEDKMNGSIEVRNCKNGACFTIGLENVDEITTT